MPQKPPFPFIFELLYPLQPETKPMFGAHGVYVGEKIVLILRQRDNHEGANGFWIATSKEHHASLRKEIPSMHSIALLTHEHGETDWQMVHVDADDFESSAERVCELILKNDPRIGRIPKSRKKKTKSKSKK